jgi:ribose 5-phosphate isomerase B
MIIYIGADHRGFKLKEYLKGVLKNDIYEVVDVGAPELVPDDDYPEYAKLVAEKVSAAPADAKGILICGSGFGVDIVANKFRGVRSALASSPDHAFQARHDDDANVLSIAADFTDEAVAAKMVKVFLTTPFAHEPRYTRRLEEMTHLESDQ